MIYQSRRWRIGARAATLAVTSVLMLLFAGPVTYAFHSDSPVAIRTSSQLFDKERPVEGAYINARGVPDLAHAFSTSELLTTYYWIPVQGYDNRLFVRTDDPQYLFPADYDLATGMARVEEIAYTGKVVSLEGQLAADRVAAAMARQGITIEKDQVMFVSQGEVPSSFRLIVPVVPFLGIVWLFAFAGLVQILRGRSARPVGQTVPAPHS